MRSAAWSGRQLGLGEGGTMFRRLALALSVPVLLLVLASTASATSVTSVSVTSTSHAAKASRLTEEVSFTATSGAKPGDLVRLTAPAGSKFEGIYYGYTIADG